MAGAPYDPRAIANLILDEGERVGRETTNLALQKLLYFAHAIYLVQHKKPLVSGYFEAWRYGPVHPAVYASFKAAGERPIKARASARNVTTGEAVEIRTPAESEIVEHVRRTMAYYGQLTPGRLVDISHAKGAPWDYVANKARTSVALGLRISDDVILKFFKHHKISVAEVPSAGEPGEDTPLT